MTTSKILDHFHAMNVFTVLGRRHVILEAANSAGWSVCRLVSRSVISLIGEVLFAFLPQRS